MEKLRGPRSVLIHSLGIYADRHRNRVTASQIDARDFLASRAKARREQLAPTGPVIVISGGQEGADHKRIWARFDLVKIRVPSMTLATTAQGKGVDAIVAAWGALREVPLIVFLLNRAHGNAALLSGSFEMMQVRIAQE